MTKAILVDVDGVIIKKHGYFSVPYAEKYNVDPSIINAFFRDRYPLCATGKADVKEELLKVLSLWKWPGSVDDLLTYWFEWDRGRDEEVITKINEWRSQGIPCYLASDQEKYRAEYLMNNVGLKDVVDGAFFSCNLGFQKNSPEFFTSILSELKVAPEEVVYFDDDQKNVEVANEIGIKGHTYQSPSDLILS